MGDMNKKIDGDKLVGSGGKRVEKMKMIHVEIEGMGVYPIPREVYEKYEGLSDLVTNKELTKPVDADFFKKIVSLVGDEFRDDYQDFFRRRNPDYFPEMKVSETEEDESHFMVSHDPGVDSSSINFANVLPDGVSTPEQFDTYKRSNQTFDKDFISLGNFFEFRPGKLINCSKGKGGVSDEECLAQYSKVKRQFTDEGNTDLDVTLWLRSLSKSGYHSPTGGSTEKRRLNLKRFIERSNYTYVDFNVCFFYLQLLRIGERFTLRQYMRAMCKSFYNPLSYSLEDLEMGDYILFRRSGDDIAFWSVFSKRYVALATAIKAKLKDINNVNEILIDEKIWNGKIKPWETKFNKQMTQSEFDVFRYFMKFCDPDWENDFITDYSEDFDKFSEPIQNFIMQKSSALYKKEFDFEIFKKSIKGGWHQRYINERIDLDEIEAMKKEKKRAKKEALMQQRERELANLEAIKREKSLRKQEKDRLEREDRIRRENERKTIEAQDREFNHSLVKSILNKGH